MRLRFLIEPCTRPVKTFLTLGPATVTKGAATGKSGQDSRGVVGMRIGAFEVEHHALLGSTNETAKRVAELGCAHGTGDLGR